MFRVQDSEVGTQIFHGIDDHYTVGRDMLHDVVHLIHGDRDTAVGAGLAVAETVQEDGGAGIGNAVRIVADNKKSRLRRAG